MTRNLILDAIGGVVVAALALGGAAWLRGGPAALGFAAPLPLAHANFTGKIERDDVARAVIRDRSTQAIE